MSNRHFFLFVATILTLTLFSKAIAQRPNFQHFDPVFNTGANALCVVPLTANPNIGGIPLQPGDEIAVFSPTGLCVGGNIWNDTANIAVTIWANNSMTSVVDGMLPGQRLVWRVWRQSTNIEYDSVEVTYTTGGIFNSTGNFAINAIYQLSSFSAVPTNVEVALSASAQSICLGSSVTLTAIAAGGAQPFSYTWQQRPIGGSFQPLAGQSSSTAVVSPSASTEYRVTATDNNQVSTSATLLITVVPPPQIAINGMSSVCQGTQTSYTQNIGAGDNITWQAQGGTIIGSTSASEVQVFWQTSPASLTLTYNSPICGTFTTTLSIAVNAPPSPVLTGADSVCRGSEYVYSVPEREGSSYSWTAIGGTITGGLGTTTLTVLWTTSTDGGSISLTESNPWCPPSTTTLSVSIIAPAEATLIGAPAVCEGSLAGYRAAPSSRLSYQWQVQGGTIIGSSSGDSITVEWRTPTQGSVSVTAADPLCGQSTATLSVQVQPVPAPVISGKPVLCSGETATYSPAQIIPGHTYQWEIEGATALSSLTATSITISASSTTAVIRLTQSSSLCGSSTAVVTPQINPLPLPVIAGSTEVCAFSTGHTYSVSAIASHTYIWSVAGGRISSGQGSPTITVEWRGGTRGTVTVEQSSPLCGSSSASAEVAILSLPAPAIAGNTEVCANSAGNIYSVAAVAGHTYSWAVIGGEITGSATSPVVEVRWGASGSGSIAVTQISPQCGTSSASLDIEKSEEIRPRISGETVVCLDKTYTYSVGLTQGNAYQWSVIGGQFVGRSDTNEVQVRWFGGSIMSLEVVQISPDCGSGNRLITVEEATLPSLVIEGEEIVCRDEQYTYTLPNEVDLNTVEWTAQGGIIVSSIDRRVRVRWLGSGDGVPTLTVLATTEQGCEVSASLTPFVSTAPPPVIVGLTEVCTGETAEYTLRNSDILTPVNVEVSGGTLLEIEGNTFSVRWHEQGTGTLILQAQNAEGCSSEEQIEVVVAPPLRLSSVLGGTISIVKGDEALLEVLVEGGTNRQKEFTWHPAEFVLSSSLTEALVRPDTTTTFTLSVADGDFCQASVEITVNVLDDVSIDQEKPLSASLSIAPNPATLFTRVQIADMVLGKTVQISLHDLQGREVLFRETIPHTGNTLSIELPLPHLAAGVYIVKVRQGTVLRTALLHIAPY